MTNNRFHNSCFMIGLVMSSLTGRVAFGEFNENFIKNSLEGFIVVLVDEAEVVAGVAGPIASIEVVEGKAIEADGLIATIEDQPWQIQLSLAEQEVKIAEALVAQTYEIDAAQSKVNHHRRKLEEHTIQSEMDRQRAANELKVAAAEKSEAVAKNEWNRAKDARGKFADAVSVSEVESMRLAYERSQLETREAKFQNRIAKLEVQLNESIAASLQTELDAALIQLGAAQSAQEIQRMETTKTQLKLKSVQTELAQRRLLSPIAGRVVSVFRRKGDWVAAGDVVARVISLDRLRVEGFAMAADAERLVSSSTVRLEVQASPGKTQRFVPQAQFISPEVDPVTGEVRLWFEFVNVDEFAKPGYRARLILGDD